jgi:hypothetical protein
MISPNMVGNQNLNIFSSNRSGSNQNLHAFSASNQNLFRLNMMHTGGHSRRNSHTSNVLSRSMVNIDLIGSYNHDTSERPKSSLEINKSNDRQMSNDLFSQKKIKRSLDSITNASNNESQCLDKFVSFWACSQPCGKF